MNNFDIDKYINTQKSSNNINLDDFPEIDLYMDQVIQLFESKKIKFLQRLWLIIMPKAIFLWKLKIKNIQKSTWFL